MFDTNYFCRTLHSIHFYVTVSLCKRYGFTVSLPCSPTPSCIAFQKQSPSIFGRNQLFSDAQSQTNIKQATFEAQNSQQ